MTLLLETLSLGSIGTNCYIVGDPATKTAVVIDPGAEAEKVLAVVRQMGVELEAIWLTHAHFDHIGGVAGLVEAFNLPVALHSDDLSLYHDLGGAKWWGIPLEAGPEPAIHLEKVESVSVGNLAFQVLHVPGHTRGHVAFYQKDEGVVFDGDVLFQEGIGRTDLPGGDRDTLMNSIRLHLLTLPDSTVVYSGHGPQTMIGHERQFNPFL